MKPKIVTFDKDGFEAAKKAQINKLNLYKLLLVEASKHVLIPDKDTAKFKTDPVGYFDNAFHQKHKGINTMSLKNDKLAFLLEINLEAFYKIANTYLNEKTSEVEPSEVDFQRVATSRKEIERYEDAQILIDALLNLKTKYNLNLHNLS